MRTSSASDTGLEVRPANEAVTTYPAAIAARVSALASVVPASTSRRRAGRAVGLTARAYPWPGALGWASAPGNFGVNPRLYPQLSPARSRREPGTCAASESRPGVV